MSPGALPRVFVWTALVIAAAARLPAAAELLGLHLCGLAWSRFPSAPPGLLETGDALGGLLAGAIFGALQAAAVRAPAALLLPAALAGLVVGAVHALWPPATLLVAPLAAGSAAAVQLRWLPSKEGRWVRGHALAAAWAALALLVPFPRWVSAALLVGAGLVGAWGASPLLEKAARRRTG